eukprot:13671458-Alexandrium_andersonii.AAC.1
MSASLVGSEMCIRDRRCRPASFPITASPRRPRPLRAALQAAASSRSNASSSRSTSATRSRRPPSSSP